MSISLQQHSKPSITIRLRLKRLQSKYSLVHYLSKGHRGSSLLMAASVVSAGISRNLLAAKVQISNPNFKSSTRGVALSTHGAKCIILVATVH